MLSTLVHMSSRKNLREATVESAAANKKAQGEPVLLKTIK
jgi:hypothetical protein